MTNMQKWRIFLLFLDMEGALGKFKRSMKEEGISLVALRKGQKPSMWLMESFTWDITPEGHGYWDELDDSWTELYIGLK